MPPNSSFGLYFLANDNVVDLAVAFLNSVRLHNPNLHICLIPYDEAYQKVRALSETYAFDIFDDRSLMQFCDDVGVHFHGIRRGEYRKLCAWGGSFERFVYIDVDTVVLKPLDFLEELLNDYSHIFGHSDIPSSRRWTWRDAKVPGLSDDEVAFAANTGFIASKAGLIGTDLVRQVVRVADQMRPSMELDCVEQPFLNLLALRSGNYSSITRLNRSGYGLPEECWAGDHRWTIALDGTAEWNGLVRNVLFVHWAGCWKSVKSPVLHQQLWQHYRDMAVQRPYVA